MSRIINRCLVHQLKMLNRSLVMNIKKSDPAETFVNHLSVFHVKKIVSNITGVSIEDMCAPHRTSGMRKDEIVIARHIAMYFSFKYVSATKRSIGAEFGGRDHSTVINAVRVLSEVVDPTNRKCPRDISMLKFINESETLIQAKIRALNFYVD